MKRRTIATLLRAATGLLVAATGACGAAPPPPIAPPPPLPAAPPPPPPIVATPDPPSPAPGPTALIDPTPAPPFDAPPQPTSEALAPAIRRFEPIALPAVGSIVDLDGRDAGDVWMIGEGSELVRWNGARAERRKTPSCPSHFEMGNGSGGIARFDATPNYRRIAVAPREIILGGPRWDTGVRGSYTVFVDARSRDGVAWSCGVVSGFGTPIHRTAGGSVIDLLHHGTGFAIEGRTAPLPAGRDSEDWVLRARAIDDVWLGLARGVDIWHSNGVAWSPRPIALATILDLWVDELGSAWVLGARSKEAREGDTVLHWDLAAKAWRSLPLPADLRARVLGGTSAHDVWIFGKRDWYQWDGTQLRRTEAPLGEANAAWASASGELFVAGADRTRKVGKGKEIAPAGAVVHAAALPEVRP